MNIVKLENMQHVPSVAVPVVLKPIEFLWYLSDDQYCIESTCLNRIPTETTGVYKQVMFMYHAKGVCSSAETALGESSGMDVMLLTGNNIESMIVYGHWNDGVMPS